MTKTLYQLAKDSGLSNTTIYRLVWNPQIIPTGDIMNKILTAIGAEIGDLLEHTKD